MTRRRSPSSSARRRRALPTRPSAMDRRTPGAPVLLIGAAASSEATDGVGGQPLRGPKLACTERPSSLLRISMDGRQRTIRDPNDCVELRVRRARSRPPRERGHYGLADPHPKPIPGDHAAARRSRRARSPKSTPQRRAPRSPTTMSSLVTIFRMGSRKNDTEGRLRE